MTSFAENTRSTATGRSRLQEAGERLDECARCGGVQDSAAVWEAGHLAGVRLHVDQPTLQGGPVDLCIPEVPPRSSGE